LAGVGAARLVQGARRPASRITLGVLVVGLAILRPGFQGTSLVWSVPIAQPLALPPDAREQRDQDEAVRCLGQLSGPRDTIVTDAPLLAFRARRNLPPGLVDVSGTRIMSGHITTREAKALTRGARLVLLWSNRLESLPGYRRWVRANYRLERWWPVRAGRRELYRAP
jgi:hypothetical protein